MKLELREYQTEALCVLLEYAKQAAGTRDLSNKSSQELPRRLLCIQPTGAGKTVLILAFVAEVAARFGWKTLLVVPSRALVAQTIERARQFFPDLKVSKISEGSFDLSGDFVVATAASLAGEKLQRIPKDYFSVLICDEAHHAAARSYKEMLDYFSSARFANRRDGDARSRRRRINRIARLFRHGRRLEHHLAAHASGLSRSSLWLLRADGNIA